MPIPQLSVDWRDFQRDTDHLSSLLASLKPLQVNHRKMVAEMVLVRLFSLAENTMTSVSVKLLCGAIYLDNTSPNINVSASTMTGANRLLKSYKRNRTVTHLSWGSTSLARGNLKHTFDSIDPVFSAVANHGHVLNEVRHLRNHIAHRSDSSRRKFRVVVRSHYGGLKQGITPGVLLLTEAFGIPTLSEKYIRHLRVFIREVVRA